MSDTTQVSSDTSVGLLHAITAVGNWPSALFSAQRMAFAMLLTIRSARPADAGVVADFNRQLAWETEHKQLDPQVLASGVARLLGDPNRGFYLLAESGGEVVGQLMATFEWSDWRDGWFWWLQSVYVREDHRRGGVFRALFAELVNRARSAGNVIGLRLYVEKDNTRAHATYEHHGLKNAGYLVRESLLADLK